MQETFWNDGNILYPEIGVVLHRHIHLLKLTKLYTWNECILLYVKYLNKVKRKMDRRGREREGGLMSLMACSLLRKPTHCFSVSWNPPHSYSQTHKGAEFHPEGIISYETTGILIFVFKRRVLWPSDILERQRKDWEGRSSRMDTVQATTLKRAHCLGRYSASTQPSQAVTLELEKKLKLVLNSW